MPSNNNSILNIWQINHIEDVWTSCVYCHQGLSNPEFHKLSRIFISYTCDCWNETQTFIIIYPKALKVQRKWRKYTTVVVWFKHGIGTNLILWSVWMPPQLKTAASTLEQESMFWAERGRSERDLLRQCAAAPNSESHWLPDSQRRYSNSARFSSKQSRGRV